MEVPSMMYADPALIDTIVGELKSQGTFDQFRKECMADVDTKPAYQNLHQRVETTVANFLVGRKWRSDLNKNQLRDSLRKHIHEMGFLETGVERIVDQVVNPKVHSVFMPQVEDVVYRVQGIPKPDKKPIANSSSAVGPTSKNGGVFNPGLFSQPPPFLPGLSFLPPALQNHMQKAPTIEDLLPKDLDPVSPESSKDSGDDVEVKEECENSNIIEESGIIQHHEDSMDSQVSGISDLTSHGNEHGGSIKSERRNSGGCEELNEDSHLSKASCSSKMSCESSDEKSPKHDNDDAKPNNADQHDTTFLDIQAKSSYSVGVVHYGDQYSLEEEVATTVSNVQEEEHEKDVKEEPQAFATDGRKSPVENIDKTNMSSSDDDQLKTKPKFSETIHTQYEQSEEVSANIDENSLVQSEDSQFSGSSDNKLHIDEMKDFNSQSGNSHQHEDEQSCLKTSSEGFLSEESDRVKAVMENVLEASEEARHGFDDSQDALERPPLPQTPPAPPLYSLERPPPPPMPPTDSSSEIEDKPSIPLIPSQDTSNSSTNPSDGFDERLQPLPTLPLCDRLNPLAQPPLPPTPPLAERQSTQDRPPLPPTPPLAERLNSQDRPPLPPTPPLADRLNTLDRPPLPPTSPTSRRTSTEDRLSLPQTPPLAERLSFAGRPPLPLTPPMAERLGVLEWPPLPPATPPIAERACTPERPPLPPTPPLAERLVSLELPSRQRTPPAAVERLHSVQHPPLPPTPPLAERLEQPPLPPLPLAAQPIASLTPPPKSREEISHDFNTSPPYDEGAIPKTPRWEPRSPAESDVHKFPSLDFLGISDSSKIPQSFIPSSKTSLKDEESQSGSEDMQLAWSPLSTHGDDDNEDSQEKQSIKVLSQNNGSLSANMNTELVVSKGTASHEKHHESGGQKDDRYRESRKEDRHKTEDFDKHREKERSRDPKSKERRKEDDRSHRESSSSSKKYDVRSSKHRENRERKDSSRSKHDDKSKTDKDRDRHSSSSHHRSDDKRRDEKERNSSKYKSSRSDDRHRHKDKDKDRERKTSSSGSSNVRHDDKSHDKSAKLDDKSRSLKSHPSERRETDRKERDKEKKSDRDKERSKKESSRHDEKKREKERDKVRKDRNSDLCRSNNERRSPDPDSNNGSMFGGNNQNSPTSAGKVSQQQGNNNQGSSKSSGSTDSNGKSGESSQHNNTSADSSALLSPTSQACPSSSLPFKKRPLLPESDAKHDMSSCQLVLKIKKLRKDPACAEGTSSRKMKAIRRLENKSIRNLDRCTKFSPQVDSDLDAAAFCPGSPTKFFESQWPTKSDDKAFLSYVQDLEQSKTLSGLSDYSGTDSEEEEIINVSDSKAHGRHDRNVMLSLSVMTEDQARKLSIKTGGSNEKKIKKEKFRDKKSGSIFPKVKSRARQRKSTDEDVEVKRRKVNVKEVIAPTPPEQKSRRARKPNKRYSNDEFTSHFDNEDDLETIEENFAHDKCFEAEEDEKITCKEQPSSDDGQEVAKCFLPSNIDVQEKENKHSAPIRNPASVVSPSLKCSANQSEQSAYSWNRDSYNSNSEDELDSTNNESDLIGTALKNLMMESGLGGPDEASGSQWLSSTSKPTLNNPLVGMNQKAIPLSGVKRVGLSRNYKGSKKLLAKQAVAKVSLGEFSLPLSPDSDVSASFSDRGFSTQNQGLHMDTLDTHVNADSSTRMTNVSNIKQYYSSEDLYKPRPPLRTTSKRRQDVLKPNDQF